MTKHWALQDAKARFSEVVRASAKGPQHITLRGQPVAVVLSQEEFGRLSGLPSAQKTKTFYEIWLSAPKVPEFKLPPRKRERMRKVEF